MKAFVVSGHSDDLPRVGILCPESSMPEMCTSQQLFQSHLETAGLVPFDSIPFRVCKYTVAPHQSALSVDVLEIGDQRFELGAKPPPKPQRPKGTIPFGLKRKKPPRKPRAKPGSKKQKGPIQTCQGGQVSQRDEDGGEQVDHESDAASSTSVSSSASSSSDSDCDSDSGSEAEQPFRTNTQKTEEKETDSVLKDHFQQSEAASSSRAAEPSNPQPTPKSDVGAGKTFCNAQVGVCEIGIQIANRLARCRHCLQPIPKGCCRIGYAYSRKKFHAYVHHGCFVELLTAESGDFHQAIDFLRAWLNPKPSKSYTPDVESLLQKLETVGKQAMSSAASSSHGP